MKRLWMTRWQIAMLATLSVLQGCSGSDDASPAAPASPQPPPAAAGPEPSEATDPITVASPPQSPNDGEIAPAGGAPPASPTDSTPIVPPADSSTPVAGVAGAGPADAGAPAATGASTDVDSGTADADAETENEASAQSPFPEVAFSDLTTAGGFTPITKTATGPAGAYNLYYPQELGRDGLRHPVLTWGNGAATVPELYPLLPALASHGFVVIAAISSFVSGAALRDGLDWLLEQDGVAGSDFQDKLDRERVGAFGYSLGSLATFEIATDPRLTTTVHISGGIVGGANEAQATAVDVPTAYFCDKDETGPNCDSDFAVVDDNPTFYGRVPGAVHVDYVFDPPFIDQMNTAVIAWLRWQMLGDPAMAPVFEGDSCTLCTDSRWEIQKKNMP